MYKFLSKQHEVQHKLRSVSQRGSDSWAYFPWIYRNWVAEQLRPEQVSIVWEQIWEELKDEFSEIEFGLT
jgi:hypothetical protein